MRNHSRHNYQRSKRWIIRIFMAIVLLIISLVLLIYFNQTVATETLEIIRREHDLHYLPLQEDVQKDHVHHNHQQEQQVYQPESSKQSISNHLSRTEFPFNSACRLDVDKSQYHVDARSNSHRHIYRGRVLQQFLERTLHHSICQSNVLIVGPDISQSWSGDSKHFHNNSTSSSPPPFDEVQEQTTYTMNADDACLGSSQIPMLHAWNEGHGVHIVPSTQSLNEWWNMMQIQKGHDIPKWFLVTYLVGDGDDTSHNPHHHHHRDNNDKSSSIPSASDVKDGSIDSILHPSRANALFEEATLTYLVVEVYAEKITSNSHGKELDPLEQEDQYMIVGLIAVETLLHYGYKLQLLASSHFDGRHRPNHLFKTVTEVEQFLKEGADFAVHNDEGHQDGGNRINVFLFATQWLDLAIPSRLSYLNVTSLQGCDRTYSNMTGRCNSKQNNKGLGKDIFVSCPKRHDSIDIRFNSEASSTPGDVRIYLNGTEVDNQAVGGLGIDMWYGNDNHEESETVCARYEVTNAVACTTRILPKSTSSTTSTRRLKKEPSYNILSILLDPLSREQMKRSLPATLTLLEELEFRQFEKFTTVGDNSGPNQYALFTGKPLNQGHDGIKHSKSSSKTPYLWDTLNEIGYVTLKAEDGCVENTNMIQSTKPNTTHGEEFHRMLCFDYDRPYCLGKDLMATHTLTYAEQFINAYSNIDNKKPWAAFVSLIDSHEDTSTLISYMDELLCKFIQKIDLSNTLVLVLSDHGLHYGPTYGSSFDSSSVKTERFQPILHVHFPKDLLDSDSSQEENLLANVYRFVTPFDVHETIKDVVSRNEDGNNLYSPLKKERMGTSLLDSFGTRGLDCFKTPGIPEVQCKLIQPTEISSYHSCTFMNDPPSIMSFYADISKENRPSLPKCSKGEEILTGDGAQCYCFYFNKRNEAVSEACSAEQIPSIDIEAPAYIKTCQNDNYSTKPIAHINVKRDESVVRDSQQIRSQSSDLALSSLPNILFIEIDSLSHKAALRHMPKTLALLRSYRIRLDENSNEVECPRGLCAAMFDKASVVGNNSISNQLVALSGCYNQSLRMGNSGKSYKWHGPKMKSEVYCPIGDIEDPWLFDVVKANGYLTFWGDEFCHSDLQDVCFPLNSTYDLRSVFCPLADNMKNGKWNLNNNSMNPDLCIGGRSRQELAFEFIRGIFDAYPDVPKFLYLKSSAALHGSLFDAAYQALGVEAYDEYLSSFLVELLSRQDSDNTVIILRGDYGFHGDLASLDFSFQVERMNHFFNLLVPKKIATKEIYYNQNKLMTGFDLYKTLRSLVSSPILDESASQSYSYDLIGETIPLERNCKQASIPTEFCPCLEERSDLMP